MARRRSLLWLFAFALVAAQALGLMHRLVHGPQAGIALEFAAQRAQAGDFDHDHDPDWLGTLFANHDDDSTCRLFDSIGHGAAPAVPALALPLVLASFFLQWFQGEALVRWAALFDARGPPSLR